MGVKATFAFLAAIVLARFLWQSLAVRELGMKRMTPDQILQWRLAHGEIDRHEYAIRLSKLHRMIEVATGKARKGVPR